MRFFSVVPAPTSRVHMMSLEITEAATELASPSVALQNFIPETLIGSPVKPDWEASTKPGHDAVLRQSMSSAFWGACRKLKRWRIETSKASRLLFSRFAPARKSTQITSGQQPLGIVLLLIGN